MNSEQRSPQMVLLRPRLPLNVPASRQGRNEALFDVARAITSSPNWRAAGSAALVVRPEPTPLFGAVGYFDDVSRSRFRALQWQLEHVLPHMRRVNYADIELAAARLANRLRERFSEGEIARFRFTAIPRGGHIVLGMLSYLLGLRQKQLDLSQHDDDPLVVVDDCALSGNRFHRFLEAGASSGPVIFAPLYSTPQLRTAVENDERVLACLSAHDLRDLAPDVEGVEYPAWQERWRKRRGDRSYWIGQPEHLCFPWSEPDFGFWNPTTGRQEAGWNLVPPQACLKHRNNEVSAKIQVQAAGTGALRPGENVLFAEFERRIVMASTSWDTCLVLEDAAAPMWTALLSCNSEEEAASDVAKAYGVTADQVRTDLVPFANQLVDRGALTRCVA